MGAGLFYSQMIVSPKEFGHSNLIAPEFVIGTKTEFLEAKFGYVPFSVSNLDEFSNFLRLAYFLKKDKYGINLNYQTVRTKADDVKIYYDLIQLGLFANF